MRFSRTILVCVAISLGCIACEKPSAPDAPASGERARNEQTSDQSQEIVDKLEQDGLSDEARLAAIHTARDENIEAAIPALRELLGDENPDLVVASAAALEGLEAKDAAGDIVEAASRLSRSQHFEHLRQLLYIIGEVGGPEARVYLETVAEGHQVPAIRLTASQVIEEMN